ncbi:hypothetical protein [Bradyrhizobium sp.]|uniref:hypothetical protein n=1 Tax=Bradyrhizobium sp. TaxID=376 RepID=UPI002E08C6C0|nr:hypothetical protein [Bradyrhizobium sp.]
MAGEIDEAQLREVMKTQGFDFDQAQLKYQQSFGHTESNEPHAEVKLPSGVQVLSAASSLSGDLGKLIWGLPYLEMAKFVICALNGIVNEHRALMKAVQKCASSRWPELVTDPDEPAPT